MIRFDFRLLATAAAVLTSLTFAVPQCQAAEDASAAVEEIKSHWQLQPELLVAGEMTVRCFRGSRPGMRMEPEQVLQIVEPLMTPERSDELEEVADMFVKREPGFTPLWGSEVTTAFSGGRVRERWSGPGVGDRDRLYDGEHSSDFHARNHQYTLTEGRPQLQYMLPSDLRVEVSPKLLDRKFDQLTYDKSTDLLYAKNSQTLLEVQRSNGFVRRLILRNGAGQIRTAQYQWLPVETETGAVLPSFRMTLRYSDGQLYLVDIAELRELRANIEIAPEKFQMAAVPGAKMVDYRGRGDGTYEVFGTGVGGPDVLQLAGTKYLPPRQDHSTGAGVLTSFTFLLLLVLLAASGLVGLLSRRRYA